MSALTPQQKIQKKLEGCGLPYKRVHVYGSQVVVTAWSFGSAERWASLLGKFAKVRPIVQTYDYNKENRGTVLKPTCHKVWLVAATI